MGPLATANRRQTSTLKYLQESANGSPYCFTPLLCVNLIFRRNTSKISVPSHGCTCCTSTGEACSEMIYGLSLLLPRFSNCTLIRIVGNINIYIYVYSLRCTSRNDKLVKHRYFEDICFRNGLSKFKHRLSPLSKVSGDRKIGEESIRTGFERITNAEHGVNWG